MRGKYPTWLPRVLTINVFVIWLKGHYMIWLVPPITPILERVFCSSRSTEPNSYLRAPLPAYPSHSLCPANSQSRDGGQFTSLPGSAVPPGCSRTPSTYYSTTHAPCCLKTATPAPETGSTWTVSPIPTWHTVGTPITVEGRKGSVRGIQFICRFMTLNSTLNSWLPPQMKAIGHNGNHKSVGFN